LQQRPWEVEVQFLFENHALDIDRRELRRGAQQIPVEPQVFDLLVYLVQNRDRVVTKDDLLDAVWSGRFVSESNLTTRINAARKAIGDSGEEQRLIRTVPRKGFRFVGVVSIAAENATREVPARTATTGIPLPLPDKPSIAVLPFDNISGDPEQEYFADGMVEEIITALSRFRQLFVIARNSTFTYKGQAVDVKQVGRELGVRYVLEGSVRKSDNRVRIAAQLIDATTAAHLWADRFDRAIENIFDLEDHLTASVVGAVAPQLQQAEIDRAKRKPTESLHAYDYFFRGMANLYQWTLEGTNEALRLFHSAIELDPDFASAYGMAAFCYMWRKVSGWMTDQVQETGEAERLARQAVALGQNDAVALAFGGFTLARVVGDLEGGAAFIDRALVLNPNLAAAWAYSGWTRIWLGEPDRAIEHLAVAMRLSPLDPFIHQRRGATALAHFSAGRYDDACMWAEQALQGDPNYVPGHHIAAASNALAGRVEKAQQISARLRQLDPGFRVSRPRDYFPFRHPKDLARYEDGLRKAGLPE
jgi:TolB-like protein/Tfp pilus assembly protein PilF